jgi:hypothetical protein
MSKPMEATYAELERALRLDLAARTLADPEAPDEHVEAARRVLESDSHELTLGDVGTVPYTTRAALEALLSGDEARRERAAMGALERAASWDAYQRGLRDSGAS